MRYYDKFLMDGWVYEPRVAARARRASPDPKALKIPTLVVHGDADTDVPFAQMEKFAAAAPPSLLETKFLDGEPHGMGGWSDAARATWCDATASFLRKHLAPWDFVGNPHGALTAY